MNLLFISHHDNFQGSSRSLLSLLEGLQKLGLSPHIINPTASPFTEELRNRMIPTEILPVPHWMTAKKLPYQKKWKLTKDIFNSSNLIRSLIKRWNIDLVYTNSSITPVGKIAADLEHIPHIWHIREFFDLYFGFYLLIPKALSIKFVQRSSAVICHSKGIKHHFFPQDPVNVHQIYNGCATRAQFDARLQSRIETAPHAEYTFAMLSVITPKKGQEEAIRALGELRRRGQRARLIIAGNARPEYLDHLKNIVTSEQLSDMVEFTGLLDDPFPAYFSADCALICSEFEALSRVGLEAMSTALPLVARNSGGNPEIIVDGETGYLYNTFDELVDYMTRLVQNPDLGRQMGLKGWQRAKKMFNIEDYAANVYQVIRSVIKNDR